MSIERIHQDKNYLTYQINGEEVIDKLDGRKYPIHISSSPIRYASIWKILNIIFIDLYGSNTTEIPDISFEMGHLFLNKRAYKILNKLLVNHGEFLPITYVGGEGYIFNPLKIAEDMDALQEDLVGFDQHGNLEHFSFNESKINQTPIFKAEIDDHYGLFCTSEFIGIVTDAKLTGIYFYPDVSNIIGGAYPIMQ